MLINVDKFVMHFKDDQTSICEKVASILMSIN